MGLSACAKCNRINQNTRKSCWNCEFALRKNPGRNRNPSDNYALLNVRQISNSAERISSQLPEGKGLKEWMEHLLAVVKTDISEILGEMQQKIPKSNPVTKYMAATNVKLIKKYADELANLLNSNIELEDWMRSKLSASASRMDDVVNTLENKPSYAITARNPLIDPQIGQDFARQLFTKNPKGETRMRSMKRFKRNPNSWSNYLSRRRNPNAAWGDSLFGQAGVWGNTLYKSRKLRRKNPSGQAPVWGAPTFGTDGVWGKTLFKRNRNPQGQAPVWGSPTFGTDGVWGKTLFRRNNKRNPQGQAPVWGSPTFGTDGVWGKTLFRNPQSASWSDPSFSTSGAQAGVWNKPLFRNRNPYGEQPATWSTPSFSKSGAQAGVWGQTLFRNPDEDDCDMTFEKNPYGGQPATWSTPAFSKSGTQAGAWGSTLFRNPDELDFEEDSFEDDLDDGFEDDFAEDDFGDDSEMDDADEEWRCNPDEDFEEEIIEEPVYRKRFKKYRRN